MFESLSVIMPLSYRAVAINMIFRGIWMLAVPLTL